jgi:hypothetical protein
VLPVRAAIISAVSPLRIFSFTSAPASSKSSISSALPLTAASASGVTPARLLAVASAPASISRPGAVAELNRSRRRWMSNWSRMLSSS